MSQAGIISASALGQGIQSINVQTGTSPVVPSGGAITFNGATVLAGTNPVQTDGTNSNTVALQVQFAQAIASTNPTNVGLAAFNSAQFTVDANGFVTDKTAITWTDVTAATQTIAAANGYITDHVNVTYTLPASGNLGDTFIIVGKTGITTIAQNAGQQILMGSASSTPGVSGSVAGTNVGDSGTFVCITSGASTIWRASSWVGNWIVT